MIQRLLCVILSLAVMHFAIAPSTYAKSDAEEKRAKIEARLKSLVTQLSADGNAGIEVQLVSGVRLKGQVHEVREDSFTLRNLVNGALTEIPYPQIKKAKAHNLTGKSQFILVSIVVAIGVAVAVIAIKSTK